MVYEEYRDAFFSQINMWDEAQRLWMKAAKAAQKNRAAVEFDRKAADLATGKSKDLSRGESIRYDLASDDEIAKDNIRKGHEAVDMLIEQAKTSADPESLAVENAMYRSDIGNIDILWGRPGNGPKFKKGYGLSHIIAKRDAEGANGTATAYKMVEVIALATSSDTQMNDQVDAQNRRLRLYHDGYTAVLSKGENRNHWLLTGWEENKTAASATGEVYDSTSATTTMATRFRQSGDASVDINNIPQSTEGRKSISDQDSVNLLWSFCLTPCSFRTALV